MRVFQSALVLIIAWPFSAAVAGDGTLVRLELEQSGPASSAIPTDNPLSDVTVSIEVDTVQPNVAEGLVFIVDIFNGSDEAIELADPTELITPKLINDDGRRCQLGEVPSMSLIRSGDPEGTRAQMDARRAYVIDRPEPGTYPTGTKTVHDIGRRGHGWQVSLGSGERLWLPLRIKQVQAQGSIRPARARPERFAIPAGTYEFGIVIALSRGETGRGSATNRLLQSETVAVLLGEPTWPIRDVHTTNDSSVEIELTSRNTPLNHLLPGAPLLDVTVTLEMNTIQPDETQGLAFTIDIFNGSRESVLISDPTQHIFPRLFDEEGDPRILPSVSAMSLFRTGHPIALRQSLDAQRAFVIDRPPPGSYDDSVETVRDVRTKDWRVLVGPGESLWLPLRIVEIQADPKAYGAARGRHSQQLKEARKQSGMRPTPPEPKRAPISVGTYKFKIFMILNRFDGERIRSRHLVSKCVDVRLGQPAPE